MPIAIPLNTCINKLQNSKLRVKKCQNNKCCKKNVKGKTVTSLICKNKQNFSIEITQIICSFKLCKQQSPDSDKVANKLFLGNNSFKNILNKNEKITHCALLQENQSKSK